MRALAIAGVAALMGLAAHAQVSPIPWRPKVGPPPPAAAPAAPAGTPAAAPPKLTLTFDEVQTPEPGLYYAKGNVRFTHPDLTLTCDALTYDSNAETLWATGSVTVDFEGIGLSGTELHYDLAAGTGEVRDAYGTEKTGLYVIQGRAIRKTGKDWFELEDGTFTSCNAAEPPWSIRISKGRFQVDHYAYLTHPRFKVQAAPVFYLPYLIWPIKPDRSTGLLLPEVGKSRRRGITTSNALFIAPSDWWDTTLYLDTFEEEGLGFGSEFRYALTPETFGWMHGYYIDQESDGRARWDFAWTHMGRHRGGWQVLADVNLVSDADFWRDYQRDYYKGTSPGPTSRLFVTKQGGPYTLNLRAERLVEYTGPTEELRQEMLPGAEFFSVLQPLGKGLYGGFAIRADALSKQWEEWTGTTTLRRELRYQRLDVNPVLEWPLRTVPWLDITPRLELRATGYTDSVGLAPSYREEGSLWREYAAFSVRAAGPRFYRRFESGRKHVVEPFVEWSYVTDDPDAAHIPVYDTVDQVRLDEDVWRYGVRNRLYARKGRMILDSEIYQMFSAQDPLSAGGGRTSDFSPVVLSVRLWPSKNTNADLRVRYNVLYHQVDAINLSVNAATPDRRLWGRLGYLESRRLGATSPLVAAAFPDTRELSIAASLKLWGDRLSIDPYLEYDLESSRWRNARAILWYKGSCYAIGIEAGRREIGTFRDTEFRLLIRLKNVGNVVDLAAGSSRYSG